MLRLFFLAFLKTIIIFYFSFVRVNYGAFGILDRFVQCFSFSML